MAKATKIVQAVPTICVQEIKTSWTKASRGGKGARKRNQVPEAATLPLTTGLSSVPNGRYPFFLHQLGYGEGTGYEAFSRISCSDVEANVAQDIINYERVRMTLDGEKLTAEYNWRGTFGSYAMKAPRRQAFLQKALEIQVGQWGRILYNERHTDFDFGIWGYGKHVFNIGLFVNTQSDVFLTSQPVKTYSKMALLW